jgi:hypothetical protein
MAGRLDAAAQVQCAWAVHVCMYGAWPFTLPGHEETTDQYDSLYYDPHIMVQSISDSGHSSGMSSNGGGLLTGAWVTRSQDQRHCGDRTALSRLLTKPLKITFRLSAIFFHSFRRKIRTGYCACTEEDFFLQTSWGYSRRFQIINKVVFQSTSLTSHLYFRIHRGGLLILLANALVVPHRAFTLGFCDVVNIDERFRDPLLHSRYSSPILKLLVDH